MAPVDDSGDVTRLLLRWRRGDDSALEELVPLVYDELRRLAARYLRSERSDHTLQPTALVHEAYARLVGAEVGWNGRVHFFAVAAGMMRRILVDHAKKRRRVKRGAGAARVALDGRRPRVRRGRARLRRGGSVRGQDHRKHAAVP